MINKYVLGIALCLWIWKIIFVHKSKSEKYSKFWIFHVYKKFPVDKVWWRRHKRCINLKNSSNNDIFLFIIQKHYNISSQNCVIIWISNYSFCEWNFRILIMNHFLRSDYCSDMTSLAWACVLYHTRRVWIISFSKLRKGSSFNVNVVSSWIYSQGRNIEYDGKPSLVENSIYFKNEYCSKLSLCPCE